MNELYSFRDLFHKEIPVLTDINAVITKIVIPKIQRPYAQGRSDGLSTYVRSTFLTKIFGHLTAGTDMELNFIYGIVRKVNDDYIFELLDGQQRVTTLFLLHWYIVNAECSENDGTNAEIRGCLRRFCYETRATSSVFCNKLSGFRANLKSTTPSRAIRKAKWYFKAFDRDSTVTAMLTMLDDIHARYTELEAPSLLDGLDRLRFYVKSLGCFNLSEELYIKMNARGLQLSPFENFKADLTDYISSSGYEYFSRPVPVFSKKSTAEVPFHENFSIKLDAKWIDIFWEKGADKFDKAYMNFFMRFFAVKYILHSDKNERDLRDDTMLKCLYKEEDQADSGEYLGFETFKTVLDGHPEYIVHLDHVLDTLFDHSDFIASELVAYWDKTERNRNDYIFSSPESKTPLAKLAVLGAVFEFVAALGVSGIPFDKDMFAKWMRVVWNIVENTNIDSISPVASLVRKFSRLATFIAENIAAGCDFYPALAGWADEQNANELRAVKEEVEKASRIAEDPQWEELFIKAERHPFFKGMVLFYYTPGMSAEAFRQRTLLASEMFDESGISPAYRDSHLLIRAIMSCYVNYSSGNQFERLRQKYLTENAETHKYLKNTLANNDVVRRMFEQALDGADSKECITERLKSLIDNAPYPPVNPDNEEDSTAYLMTLRRLRHDTRLYDWFASQEADYRSPFRVYDFENQYAVAIPNKRFARVTIESDRGNIARELCDNYGMAFKDLSQEEMIEEYGEVAGTEMWLYKDFDNSVRLNIGFLTRRIFRFEIDCPSEKTAVIIAAKLGDSVKTDEYDSKKLYVSGGHYVTSDYSMHTVRERLDSVIKVVGNTLFLSD